MASVDLEKRGSVAILWMNNPPVNALSSGLRHALAVRLDEVRDDREVRSIVVASRQPQFSSGADISEFGKPLASPTLRDLIAKLDDSHLPIVAAINGVALGGGLELALACDKRVAAQSALVGLPETNLGLVPGSGATQRVPRLAGAAFALQMMADAKPRSAEDARQSSIIDKVVSEEHLIDTAIRLAAELESRESIRVRDRNVDTLSSEAFEVLAAKLSSERSEEPQINALIESIRATFSLDFDAGLKLERSHFEALVIDDRSRALRHMFFADRQTTSRFSKKASTREASPVRSVGVVGGGTMGAGIAMAFAGSGFAVTLKEVSEYAAANAVAKIKASLDRSVAKGSITPARRDETLSRIVPAEHYDALRDTDLVIEAAFEDLTVKQEIFRELKAATSQDTVLATNTSYLDVDDIGDSLDDKSRLVGMHFFSPANIMKLVEVVRAQETSDHTLATIIAATKAVGKLPVVVGNKYGFVGNRILARRSTQLDRLLLEGATPEQIDAIALRFGFKLGPCATADLAGLDISWRMRQATGRKAPGADRLVEAGRLGQKVGRGYFKYEGSNHKPVSDPEAVDLLQQVSSDLSIKRRAIEADEILDRLLLPMVDEGAQIFDEGVASELRDIDVVWVHGYGFPRHRGGPMFYGQSRGYNAIVERLTELAALTGDHTLTPSAALLKLATKSLS